MTTCSPRDVPDFMTPDIAVLVQSVEPPESVSSQPPDIKHVITGGKEIKEIFYIA